MVQSDDETLADVLLELLAQRGVELFLANPGTDFVSLIDGFAKREKRGLTYPKPLTAAHETTVITLAHGYYLATGKPAAAMVHVGIGTANALAPLMAASRANIPIIFMAGRTPVTQSGHPASRSAYIHWGQDAYDQTASVREWVKWDYEIKRPEDLASVIDRAMSLAMTEPKGPVCLTLPREILYDPPARTEGAPISPLDLPTQPPDPDQISRAAQWLAQAEKPLIITSSVGRNPGAVGELAALAQVAGAGVVSFNAEYLNLPRSHPCFQGFHPDGLLSEADLVIVLECATPWYPNTFRLNTGAKRIHIGADPLYARVPMRQFPSDLTLQADPERALRALTSAVADDRCLDKRAVAKRLEALTASNLKRKADWAALAEQEANDSPLSPRWISSVIGRIAGSEWVLFNEYHNEMPPFAPDRPGQYFCVPQAGFLGWSHGAALGWKLGRPEAKVMVTVGDGAYLFGAPTPCHLFSRTNNLPILTVIYNNSGYHAVRRATRMVHPHGAAVKSGKIPLADLGDTSDLHRIVEAFGGYGERVERPENLIPTLDRAVNEVVNKGRQAVVNVITAQR
jgi:acetolactate synthase-1/2/3 large subunit